MVFALLCKNLDQHSITIKLNSNSEGVLEFCLF